MLQLASRPYPEHTDMFKCLKWPFGAACSLEAIVLPLVLPLVLPFVPRFALLRLYYADRSDINSAEY